MDRTDRAALELREMDELAAMKSPVHFMHPLSKLIITISYILVTVSFGKYELSGLLVMVLYPLFVFSLSGISVGTCFRKLRFVLPLVCAVGLFNPFFDRAPLLTIGKLVVSGGVLSMITLMLKGVLCLQASFLLAATTSMDALCAALRKLHVPDLLVTMLLLTYRYISVMAGAAAASQHGPGGGALCGHAAERIQRRIPLCRSKTSRVYGLSVGCSSAGSFPVPEE